MREKKFKKKAREMVWKTSGKPEPLTCGECEQKLKEKKQTKKVLEKRVCNEEILRIFSEVLKGILYIRRNRMLTSN